MSNRLVKILFVFGFAVITTAFGYPLLASYAQNSDKVKEKSDLTDVKKLVVAENFYNFLKTQQSEWILTETNFTAPMLVVGGSAPSQVGFLYTQGKEQISISIMQYPSIEEAGNSFVEISQGIIKKCTEIQCGDGGRMIYRLNGQFNSLEFRKGIYRISVSGESEDTAKEFAQYVIQSIG